MSFIRTLHATVSPLVEVVEGRYNSDTRAAAVIAHFAPNLLRRLAEIATIFDAPGLHAGQGAILACRSRADGYRAVEYDAPDLAISFDIRDGTAHLRWRSGNEADDRLVTMETPEVAIEASLLDAVSAYVNQRIAHAAV